ncbi:MAG: hypothetical protein J7497_01850 [Chitinophagaceae bacterium]|nr:hypothetical protein [Chitinophagaceae bacterium]
MEINDPFEEFLKKNQNKNKDFDAELRKDKWVKSVDSLFDNVEKWLQPFFEQKLMSARRKEFQLTEDFIGYYQTERMELFVGSQILTLKPVGTLVIGSLGRIDFIGPHHVYMLVQKEWDKWSFAFREHTYDKPKYVKLKQDIFKAAIQDLIQGTHEIFK